MKIAVIDHIANPGGGARVVRSLLAALQRVRPDAEITFFGSAHAIVREEIEEITTGAGIAVKTLSSMALSGKDLFNIRGSRHIVTLLQRKWEAVLSPLPYLLSGQLHKELEAKVRGYDIALFTWPFHMRCPDLDCPMVGIFHDFNFRYCFGGYQLTPWVLEFLLRETPRLLQRMVPVVPTEHMRGELEKFYPEAKEKARVIPMAAPARPEPVAHEVVAQVLNKFGVPKQYLLSPTNHTTHKNSGALMAAFSLLKKRGLDCALVFVGPGTENYNGRACYEGIERGLLPQDVFGLGYVSHLEIEALIQGAMMVINPSLYEGGNCPGFDAWIRGVPVAMSNIPPFMEHLQFHGVKAVVFNPRDVEDMAEKIEGALARPEGVAQSLENMRRYTWEMAAEKYFAVFDEVRR